MKDEVKIDIYRSIDQFFPEDRAFSKIISFLTKEVSCFTANRQWKNNARQIDCRQRKSSCCLLANNGEYGQRIYSRGVSSCG